MQSTSFYATFETFCLKASKFQVIVIYYSQEFYSVCRKVLMKKQHLMFFFEILFVVFLMFAHFVCVFFIEIKQVPI